jgi:hypothetical protein
LSINEHPDNMRERSRQQSAEIAALRARAEAAEERVAELDSALKSWITENGPGGWINALREDVPRLRKRVAALEELLRAFACSFPHETEGGDCCRLSRLARALLAETADLTPKTSTANSLEFRDNRGEPRTCATCNGSGITSAPHELDAEDCPDCGGAS